MCTILVIVITSFVARAQDYNMTFDETLDYLNETLKIAKNATRQSYYQFSVSSDGIMTIVIINPDFGSTRPYADGGSIYLKSLSHTELINSEFNCLLNFYIRCPDCAPHPYRFEKQLSMQTYNCPKNLSKAFNHLISLSKNKSTFVEKPKPKKDPFDD